MKKLFFTLLLLSICILKAQSQPMNVTFKTVSHSTHYYTINATYPQVDFGPGALMGVRGIAHDINNSIDTTVDGIINDFKKQVSENHEKTFHGHVSSLSITSNAWISNGSFLSSEMMVSSYIAGMAHPMTIITTFNMTDASAAPVTLGNLFKSNSDYLKFVSNYCITELKAFAEKEGDSGINDMITSGAAPDAQNFSEWSIKNDSLNIIFNPYQVAPYAFGIQRVPIPLSNLLPMLDPKGPLAYMFR